MKKITQFSKDTSGTAAIEYALLIALIIMLGIDGFNAVGGALSNLYGTFHETRTITNRSGTLSGQPYTEQIVTVTSSLDPNTTTKTTMWNSEGNVTSEETVSVSPTTCSGNTCTYSGSQTNDLTNTTDSYVTTTNGSSTTTVYTYSNGQTTTETSTTTGNTITTTYTYSNGQSALTETSATVGNTSTTTYAYATTPQDNSTLTAVQNGNVTNYTQNYANGTSKSWQDTYAGGTSSTNTQKDAFNNPGVL